MSEEARRTLRYVESLSDARTPLADFFSILLKIITRRAGEAGRREMREKSESHFLPILSVTRGTHAE